MLAEVRGRAMGTDVHIVVAEHDHALLRGALADIADLERRWSRFLPDSEISEVNRHAGSPVIVSAPTFELVARAIDGWLTTDGRFDPTVHDALVAAGYDRTFDEIATAPSPRGTPSPGAHGIHLDPVLRAVTLPPGVRLDLGGIGKGAAADLVSARVRARGGDGVCIAIGGDVRVRGSSPFGPAWPLTLRSSDGRTRVVETADGAACTSTTTRRRWPTTTGSAHHLIDPATGRPTETDLATVTVCASDAADAEVLTKSAIVLGSTAAADDLARLAVDAVLETTTGEIIEVGRIAETVG